MAVRPPMVRSDFSTHPSRLHSPIHLSLTHSGSTADAVSVSAARMGIADALYRVVMRRNAVYVTFVVAGAFVGERAVDYGVHKLWEMNNVGKRYEDISVLGQRPAEE